MKTKPSHVGLLAAGILLSLASAARAEKVVSLSEIDATVVLPAGWSLVSSKPVDGRPEFTAYTINNGQTGGRAVIAAVVVGPYGVAARPETLAKLVDALLDVNADIWRRFRSIGEAHEVQRAATEIQGMTAGFAVVEIACPPLFDGPPDIMHTATFAAVDGERSFVCTIGAADASWPTAWPAFKQMVNSLRLRTRG